MLQGILAALAAGVMLGVYAIPEKFTKDFKYENTWSLFFFFNLIIIPIICSLLFINNFGEVLSNIPVRILLAMILFAFLWGFGCQLWSKALDYIGVSLGFSIFIGVVIIVGSTLPFIISGLPPINSLLVIIGGLLVIVLGVVFNGKAGILRKNSSENTELSSANIRKGILIAVLGGLLATGFSLANAVGFSYVDNAMQAQGNAPWLSALGVMIIVYISGAIYNIPFFIHQLSKKNFWKHFHTKALGGNVSLIFLMGLFNFAASVTFAYSASILGAVGNTVGYAIYNTASILVAVIGGIITSEWGKGANKAKKMLYMALIFMVIGIVIIAYGNSLAS